MARPFTSRVGRTRRNGEVCPRGMAVAEPGGSVQNPAYRRARPSHNPFYQGFCAGYGRCRGLSCTKSPQKLQPTPSEAGPRSPSSTLIPTALGPRGSTTKWRKIRAWVLASNNHRCWICGGEAADSVDHVNPRSTGGEDQSWNLAGTHRACNTWLGKQSAHTTDPIESVVNITPATMAEGTSVLTATLHRNI